MLYKTIENPITPIQKIDFSKLIRKADLVLSRIFLKGCVTNRITKNN